MDRLNRVMTIGHGTTVIRKLITVGAICYILYQLANIYHRLQKNDEMYAVYKQFVYSLEAVRHEAKKKRINIVLCGSDNGRHCNVNNFSHGWVAFIDDGLGGGIGSDGVRNGSETLIFSIKQPGVYKPQLRNDLGSEVSTIIFNRKGYSNANGRLFASIYDPATNAYLDKKITIDRSGFISGVDQVKARASLDALP